MNNLIFVSKEIGLECLKFHLESFQNDENYIVVCEPGIDLICSYLDSMNHNFILHKDFSMDILKGVKINWLMNLWGSHIFKDDILKYVENSINIHPSYLPYGRGRDPVVWAIRDQVPAGVTLHEISLGVDAGDIWYQEEVPYDFPVTGKTLYERVVAACIHVFKTHWPRIRCLDYQKILQPCADLKTRRRKDLLEDRSIDYEKLTTSQKEIFQKILAHDFGDQYTAIVKYNSKVYSMSLKWMEI